MKKQTKHSLTVKLDKEVSRIVRGRGYCQFCGLAIHDKLQCCHIYSRSYRNTRWSLNNLLCLCAGCHFKSHMNPVAFTDQTKMILGEYAFMELKAAHNTIKRWTIPEMEELLKTLEAL